MGLSTALQLRYKVIRKSAIMNTVARRSLGSVVNPSLCGLCGLLWLAFALQAQTLLNIDFGVGSRSAKTGWAATGQGTNDYWNLYRHYDPKYLPGMRFVTNGILRDLKWADGSASGVEVSVTNAPGVWGNATGDPMYDTYLFAENGSNMVVTLRHLPAGRYHFYLYGHGDPDVTGEQNSVFTLQTGTNVFGPMATAGSAGWKATSPWQERFQYVVFRDVPVWDDTPVMIQVGPGVTGAAVLNGLQVVSRGTSPSELMRMTAPRPAPALTNLLFQEVRYAGKLTEREARFDVDLTVESQAPSEISGPLFDGDLAVSASDLPESLRIVFIGGQFRLYVGKPGVYRLKVELVAKIRHAEPWNEIAFVGPPAAIAAVEAQATGAGVELQLMSGTLMETRQQEGLSRVQGFLGGDRVVALRWRSKVAEVLRKSFVSVDTTANVLVAPAVVKYVTQFRYEILQAAVPRLTIALPSTQALTRLEGDQIRDWRLTPETAGPGSGTNVTGETGKALEGRQLLTVEFIKPIEKVYQLNLYSEQPIPAAPLVAGLAPPQPLEVQRESGTFTISTDDMLVEVQSAAGLRQMNAPAGAVAAYKFSGRPFSLAAGLKRIEPQLTVADRVTARLEETRLLITHALALTVEKAAIYGLEVPVPSGFTVSDVHGERVEDWKMTTNRLQISFAGRILGTAPLAIQLEQALRQFPERIMVAPLRLTNAVKETAEIGAVSSPGIRLKTAELTGLREIPISTLSQRTDELLAYASDQGDWRLTLASERLSPRVVADVFNLVTVGDGLVGGSATIRFGILNQGVQEFRLRLPANWKNIEFTGPGIRRKEQRTNDWLIGLQDKAWGGYTLVVTYDFPFDPKGASLDIGGAHALEVERETGSVALITAAGLQLQTTAAGEPLQRIDESELAPGDRAIITRPVLLAYRYSGGSYRLVVQATRFDRARLLEAVTDRTQLTTVLTEAGQMLTQASFMVKNNEKQFQRFRLPNGADFWSCFVNGQATKAERDGAWLLVPLPREANRDQAFAVDLVYAQTNRALGSSWPQALTLEAPGTDVPNTYAEWELFVPKVERVSGFGGSMTVRRGTVYGWAEAWQEFTGFYGRLIKEDQTLLALCGLMILGIVAITLVALRQRWKGLIAAAAILAGFIVLAGMLLPTLAKSKSQAQRIRDATVEVGQGSGEQRQLPEQAKEEPGGQRAVVVRPTVSAQPPVEGAPQYTMSEAMRRRYGLAGGGTIVRDAEGRARRLAEAAPNVPPGQGRGEVNAPAVSTADATMPMAAGIRPLRIEIPREGQAYAFSKVLNLRGEPLTVRARLISAKVFMAFQTGLQALVFLAGLLLIWRTSRRDEPSSFKITVGLLLCLGAAGYLLLAHGLLHYGLILAVPVLVMLALVWVGSTFWPRRNPAVETAGGGVGASPLPPAATLLVVLLLPLAAQAAEATDELDAQAKALSEPLLAASSASARRPFPFETNEVTIPSATYQGSVAEGTVRFEATIRFTTPQTNQTVRLFGADVAVEAFGATPAKAQLRREGQGLSLHLDERGETTVQIRFLVKLGGDVTKRQLQFGLPPALYSRFVLQIDEPEAEVEFPTALSFNRTQGNQQTRVEAILGSGRRVDVRWTPRVKRAAEIAATVFCQNLALVTVGGGVINTRCTLEYQIAQGELRQLRVRLPAGQRLVRVEGDSIRTWDVGSALEPAVGSGAARTNRALAVGAQVIAVELLKNMSTNYKLQVETESVLQAVPARVAIEIPQALEVKRETGLVGLRTTEELSLSADSPELQRLDAEEFGRSTGIKGEFGAAFRFQKPEFQLLARVEAVQPQLEAVLRNTLLLGSDRASLTATVSYLIRRAGLFSLRVVLPPDYRLEKVSGEKVLQWMERKEGTNRVLEVTLREKTMGNYGLSIELVQSLPALPKTFAVQGIYPLGMEKLTSFVSATSESGIAIKTGSFDGLTEIPATALAAAGQVFSPGRTTGAGNASVVPSNQQAMPMAANPLPGTAGAGVLAFKLTSPDPALAGAWKLVINTETVEPWVRAETVQTFTLTETLLLGRALVRYDIANAPVREFRLRIPAAFTNIEVIGPNIRRRDQTNDQWRVELQNKLQGQYLLTVTWEQSRATNTASVELSGIEALGVERENGNLAIVARPPLQVTESDIGDLLRMDPREMPEWAGRPNEAAVFAYQYLRPGYKLKLEVRRYEEAQVLQALVDSANLTTVWAEDGQTITAMSLAIRNNGRQYLEVEPPAGGEVWSAFVAGQAVRPGSRAGRYLLPLERSGADGAPIDVELTFVATNQFPRTKGSVSLASPKLDVPIKNARWKLYLPPKYKYADFGGSMLQESGLLVPVSAGSFSLSSYTQQEEAKQQALHGEAQQSLRKARSQLAEGKVREAVENYRNARVLRGNLDVAANNELKVLENDLNRFQGGNLIQAQNAFSLQNGVVMDQFGSLGQRQSQTAQGIGQLLPQQGFNYDNAAAERQWSKLQQAQDVAVARVQPLRVNLPTVGLPYNFSQVLQTEIRAPMTISFVATNAEAPHWGRRVIWFLAGLVMLWTVVGKVLASLRTNRQSPAL